MEQRSFSLSYNRIFSSTDRERASICNRLVKCRRRHFSSETYLLVRCPIHQREMRYDLVGRGVDGSLRLCVSVAWSNQPERIPEVARPVGAPFRRAVADRHIAIGEGFEDALGNLRGSSAIV